MVIPFAAERIAGDELPGSLGIIETSEHTAQAHGQILGRIYPQWPGLRGEQKIEVPWFCPKVEQEGRDLGDELLGESSWGQVSFGAQLGFFH